MKKFVLAVIAVFLCGALWGCGSQKSAGDGGNVEIVTSFYPIYIDVINITKGVGGVNVTNMTEPQTGCLHDYQLTTGDMKTLEKADIFVVNGAGMESFLDKVISQRKNLKIVDSSKWHELHFIKDGDEVNPHIWMSVTYSMMQVKEIVRGLCEADPAHSDQYKKNALEYVTRLTDLRREMHDKLDNLPHRDIVTFHEAFPYFAAEFKLNIAAVIEREPGTEPTPGEIRETIEKVNGLEAKALFTEPQYSPTAAETIARETGAKIYPLDPIVTGEANEKAADDYIIKMKKNMETLEEALK